MPVAQHTLPFHFWCRTALRIEIVLVSAPVVVIVILSTPYTVTTFALISLTIPYHPHCKFCPRNLPYQQARRTFSFLRTEASCVTGYCL